MSELATLSMAAGAAIMLAAFPGLMAPARTRALLLRFPRSRIPAWLLTAVDLVWAGVLLYGTPLGRFDSLKPALYAMVPVSIVLVSVFVDELLAPRALGGLLLLVAAPMLDIARWHDSAWRLVIVVLAYLIVLKGLVLVISPFYFRKAIERFFTGDGRIRAWCGACLAVGVLVLVLGLKVF